MMTESDARQRWCPFARYRAVDAAVNRSSDPDRIPDSAHCLASGCMAWRWYGDDLGYCGLAGPASD